MDQQQCIFCGIANGSVPSKTVYEDDRLRAVLDIYPANPAHLLVMTKQHYSIFNQLSEDEVKHLGIISKRISELMFKVIKPEGINFFIANGQIAGQKAPHFMLHAIPRFSGDGLSLDLPVNPVDEKQLNAFYDNIKKTLKNYFPNVDFESPPSGKEQPGSEMQANYESGGSEEETEEKQEEKEAKETPEKNENREGPAEEKKDDVDLDKITEMFS